MSLLTFMNDPTIPAWYKKKKWDSAPQGAKNEYYYEKVRNGARWALGGQMGDTPNPSIMAGRAKPDLDPLGTWMARMVVPEDLQSFGSLVGAVGGTAIGHPFLGAEAGGTLGGMAQGRSAPRAAAAAALPALANWGIPKLARTLFASRIAKAMSDWASGATSDATAGLFKSLWADNPDLPIPRTPQEMEDFYASGQASPAVQKTGESLGKFRKAIRSQPAFYQAKPIEAPFKFIDPLTHTPRYGHIQMSLQDAIDYQQALYDKGYMVSGGPRGGTWAEPDRAIASEMRGKILDSLRTIPRSGPHLAAKYEGLTRDYGLAQTMKDVFKGATDEKGLLDHEKVYQNLANQKTLTHLNSLVGSQDTRGYLGDVAPGRQRVTAQNPGHISGHAPGGLARIGIQIPKSPTGPSAFTPGWPKVAGNIVSQGTTQGIENIGGGGGEDQ